MIVMQDRKIYFLVLLFVLGANHAKAQTLASADCVNYAEHTYAYPTNNAIGLSMDLI